MKIATLSALLSVVSLAAVVVLAVKVNELSDELALSRSSRPSADRRSPDESRDLTYGDLGYRAPPPKAPAESSGSALVAAPTESDEREPIARGTVEERLAKLERDVDRQRSHAMPTFRGPRFVRNFDDLSDHLNLTRSQRDRVEDSIRRGRERIAAC